MSRLLPLFVVLFFSSTCFAQPQRQQEQGFAAELSLGVIFIDSANNLNPGSSDKRISDFSAPDRELSVIPVIRPAFSYVPNDPSELKLYLDTEPPIDEAGTFGIRLGGSHTMQSLGILDISLFANPFEEAYENPYQLNAQRKSTDTSKYGVRISLNKILGSQFRANFTYLYNDVDNDVIGDLFEDLNREGNLYGLSMSYTFLISKAFNIRPRISYRRGDFDGESNAYDKVKFDLGGRYTSGRITFLPRASIAFSEYDSTHPIFNETRDNTSYSFLLLTNIANPLDLEDWSLQLLAGYSQGESNIDFFDTESINAGVFATYNF